MKKQIWKFNLLVQSIQKIEIPRGAEIISVQSQNGIGVMWAICDTMAEKETRTFMVFGTGHNIPSKGLKYMGTYQENGGSLVWHLFEVIA